MKQHYFTLLFCKYSQLALKTALYLRGYFSWRKADDEARLSPGGGQRSNTRKRTADFGVN
jgi:hypothetical protein